MSEPRRHVEVFDTTLRDGLQVEGVSASVEDKLRIAEQLDLLGVQYIEGGWPGANPKDIEFFARAATELQLATSTLVAFGSTRRPRGKVDDDATLRNLVEAGTSAVCIVAKSSDYHVTQALQTTLDEGEAMIADSVEYLTGQGRRVLVDMEHFFDGYKENREFSLRALEAAVVKGASHVVLCDTNGGSLPHEIGEIVAAVHAHVGTDVVIGIHCHDDTGCAVANSMAAVFAGAGHVQGTLNGLGERTGNANLTTIIPNLQLKLGYTCLPDGRLERLTAVSHHVAELLNRAVNPQSPYVGSSAFAHKAGLHTSAIARAKDAYEHVDPELVGNGTRFVVSEMAGRATITMKAAELGLEMDGPAVNTVIDDLKRLEHEGFHFEAADASLELLMRRASGWEHDFFRVESMRVITDELPNGDFTTEATVKVWVGDDRRVHTAEGNGPVNAIDTALRAALNGAYPELDRVHLTDFKVRILDGAGATGAVTRVLLDATDGQRDWTTIGVSANIIEASWRALEESIVYGLLHGGIGLTATRKRVAVRVTRDAERQVRGGHPWVFDASITSTSHEGEAGDLAVVFDADRNFVAIGLWDPTSPIRIRILHRGRPTAIDDAFWRSRIGAALDIRRPLAESGTTTAYRVVHGENDGLPGLVIDRYDDTYVVKIYTAAWLPHLDAVVGALDALVRPVAIVLRRSRRVGVGGEDGTALLGASPDEPVPFLENGLVFEADVVHGQKTGHFLDQRDNRALVGSMATGARVLDVFSCTGGFAVHAAAGGASAVTSVDQSSAALATAKRNMALNTDRPEVRACTLDLIVGDAFDAMATMARRGRHFDIVVVDPPSFASRQSSVAVARRSYGRLTSQALALLQPGGLLVQASCSSRVSADDFVDTVFMSARSAGHHLTVVARTGHPLDHPVGFPEGAYLKALFARLDA